jgi:hypothetical protein
MQLSAVPGQLDMIYLSGQVSYVSAMLAADPGLPIGVMLTPAIPNRVPPGITWAADNDCFSKGARFDADAWVEWLAAYPAPLDKCLFAVMPDVYGDAEATREQYGYYLPDVCTLGYRVAYVAQDGEREDRVPWHLLDCLFIGATTAWKLSEAAHALVRAAKRRGKWVHIGRVNSERRLRSFAASGADSADGTILCFDPKRPIKRWLAATNQQPSLLGELE